jgi:hypothetical protein
MVLKISFKIVSWLQFDKITIVKAKSFAQLDNKILGNFFNQSTVIDKNYLKYL